MKEQPEESHKAILARLRAKWAAVRTITKPRAAAPPLPYSIEKPVKKKVRKWYE